MSFVATAWAWQQEGLDPTEKLVLLALADHHNESSGRCFPSRDTIGHRVGIARSTISRQLASLEERGLIMRAASFDEYGRQTTNSYQLNLGGGVPVDEKGEVPTGAKGKNWKLEPVELPNGSSTGERPRNELWDALTELFGEPATRSAQTLRGRVCKSLAAADAGPEEVLARARAWPRHFDNATLTETALEKHWHTLARTPMRLEEKRGRSLRAAG